MCIPCRNRVGGSASTAASTGVHRITRGSPAAAGAARAGRGTPPNMRGTPYATAATHGVPPRVVPVVSLTRRCRAAYIPTAPSAAAPTPGSNTANVVRGDDMLVASGERARRAQRSARVQNVVREQEWSLLMMQCFIGSDKKLPSELPSQWRETTHVLKPRLNFISVHTSVYSGA